VGPTFGYVVEWSPSQRAFHIQSLAALVTDNMVRLAATLGERARVSGEMREVYFPDYVPVAVFPTEDEANEAAKRLVRMRDDPPVRPGPEVWPE
jgi:DTW domain-containing protein YfiP